MSNLKSIPLPGYRIIKTALAVLLCLICYKFIHREGVSLAAVAAVLCMQDSVEKSIVSGINRVQGTLLGGFFAALWVLFGIPFMSFPFYVILVSLGIALFIYITNLLRLRQSIDMGCIVFLTIMIDVENAAMPLTYCISRTIDTLIGIIIAVLINRFLVMPESKKAASKTAHIPLKYEVHRKEEQKHINKHSGNFEPVKGNSSYELNTKCYNGFFALENNVTLVITDGLQKHTEVLSKEDFFVDSCEHNKNIDYKVKILGEPDRTVAVKVSLSKDVSKFRS